MHLLQKFGVEIYDAVVLTRLSQLEGKSKQNQWGNCSGLHYRVRDCEAWAGSCVAAVAVGVMRGGGWDGRLSLSCLTNSF